MESEDNHKFVHLAIPIQHYPKMVQLLSELMQERAYLAEEQIRRSAVSPDVSLTKTKALPEWSEEELRELWYKLSPQNTVGLAILDMTAAQPGSSVLYPDACKQAGLSVAQGRAHIGAFTKVCNKIRQGEWPIGTGRAEGGNYRYYVMSPATAERWRRVTSSQNDL